MNCISFDVDEQRMYLRLTGKTSVNAKCSNACNSQLGPKQLSSRQLTQSYQILYCANSSEIITEIHCGWFGPTTRNLWLVRTITAVTVDVTRLPAQTPLCSEGPLFIPVRGRPLLDQLQKQKINPKRCVIWRQLFLFSDTHKI